MEYNISQQLRQFIEEYELAQGMKGEGQGEKTVQKSSKDGKRPLRVGRYIEMHPHPRFVHGSSHHHNYIEMTYVCQGSLTYKMKGRLVTAGEGDILLVGRNCCHELLAAGTGDIGVKLIILPEFFSDIFYTLIPERNIIYDFMIKGLQGENGVCDYLYFKATGHLPIQNLMENILWLRMKDGNPNKDILQMNMILLFAHLFSSLDPGEQPGKTERGLVLRCLQYIEERYWEGNLGILAAELDMSIYSLSRLIKEYTGNTFKEMVQDKRLDRAAYLLKETKMGITQIIKMVGYDNTSYFYKIFREKYGMSPKEYRRQ